MTYPYSMHGVRVHLERSWQTRSWNVYAYNTRPGFSTLWRWDGTDWVGTESPEGTMPDDAITAARKPYSLALPDDLLEAIVAQAIEKMPADGSMAAHLKDAQSVRDRLLALIEARGLR